jgi:hypothetical protein
LAQRHPIRQGPCRDWFVVSMGLCPANAQLTPGNALNLFSAVLYLSRAPPAQGLVFGLSTRLAHRGAGTRADGRAAAPHNAGGTAVGGSSGGDCAVAAGERVAAHGARHFKKSIAIFAGART